MSKPWENKSGYPDPTAHSAIEAVIEEERRVSELVMAMKIIAKLAGFEITNRVELRSVKTRSVYR